MYHFDREAFNQRRARLGYIASTPVVNINLVRPAEKKTTAAISAPEIKTPKAEIPIVLYVNRTPDELMNALAIASYRTPISTIIRSVSVELNIGELSIQDRDKRDEIVYARYMIFWLCRQARYSLPQIGKAIGGRDHTTVLHGVKQFEKHLAEDGQYAAIARRLLRNLITARPAPYWGA